MSLPAIRAVARKEFFEMRRDGRFRSAAIIILALLLASFALGAKQFRSLEADKAAAHKADREQWLHQGKRNPHAAAHYGRYAFRPDNPLAIADGGINAYVGNAVWLEAHNQNPVRYRAAEDASDLDRFRAMTAATVLQMLLPLLIILLTFGAVAGEREAGTLRQLLSVGANPRNLMLGKAWGVSRALSLILVPTTVTAAAILALAGGAASPLFVFPRFLIFIGAYLLYFATWIFLSLAVSAWATSARTSLLVLLGFWMIGTLILPRAATSAAERLRPAPNNEQFWGAIERERKNGPNRHDPSNEAVKKLLADTLKKYGVKDEKDLPVNFAGIALTAGETFGNQVYDRNYQNLWDTYRAQERIHDLSALFSPLPAVRGVSMGMAGTDLSHYMDFARAAEAHRRRLQTILNGEVTEHKAAAYEVDDAYWKTVPEFHYTSPGAGWALEQQALPAAFLLIWCAASFIVMQKAASRLTTDA